MRELQLSWNMESYETCQVKGTSQIQRQEIQENMRHVATFECIINWPKMNFQKLI